MLVYSLGWSASGLGFRASVGELRAIQGLGFALSYESLPCEQKQSEGHQKLFPPFGFTS